LVRLGIRNIKKSYRKRLVLEDILVGIKEELHRKKRPPVWPIRLVSVRYAKIKEMFS